MPGPLAHSEPTSQPDCPKNTTYAQLVSTDISSNENAATLHSRLPNREAILRLVLSGKNFGGELAVKKKKSIQRRGELPGTV